MSADEDVAVDSRPQGTEGLIVKEASFASSKRFRLTDGISFGHSGQYRAFGPFDDSGP